MTYCIPPGPDLTDPDLTGTGPAVIFCELPELDCTTDIAKILAETFGLPLHVDAKTYSE